MTLIKRYPNRKLYDTSARQYVSLEAVAALIRGGETVQVIEHGSGEDITALILTQIISEQERRGGFLPLEVLTGLVQAGGTTLAALRRGPSAIDPGELGGSAWQAAATSFVLFILGAIVPVLPFLFASGNAAVGASLAVRAAGRAGGPGGEPSGRAGAQVTRSEGR